MSEQQAVPVTETTEVQPQPTESATVTPPVEQATGGDSPEQAEVKRRSGFEKRIERFVRTTRELNDERDRLNAENARLQSELAEFRQRNQPKGDGAPQAENFRTYEEYIDARASWVAEQKASAIRKADELRSAQERQVAEQKELLDNFASEAEKFAATVPDFDESVGQVRLSQSVSTAIVRNDQGPKLAYFLAHHPAEMQRLDQSVKNDPVKAAIELARLEIKAASFIQSRTQSKAPPAPSPMPKGGAQGTGLSDDLPIDEWQRRFYERMRKRR